MAETSDRQIRNIDMLVSVLMSVYKEETRFLREAIESILNQTYADFEFVIVGDSPQSDRERVFGVVEEYASQDHRIKFFPNDTNIGLTKSLNVGLGHCQGKYVARMDADDISLPTRLEKQVAFMEENPHILASGAWYEVMTEEGERTGILMRHAESTKSIRLFILTGSVLAHPVSIYHRVISGMAVKYDESIKYAQDYALWVWILRYGDISNIQEVLLFYRKSKTQITTSHSIEQQACAREAQRRAFESLYSFPIKESFMDVFSSMTINHCNVVSEEQAMRSFQEFLEQVKVTRKNFDVLMFIIDIYVRYSPKVTPKNTSLLLYRVTKGNIKLLFLSEMNYVCRGFVRIVKTVMPR